MSKAYKVSHKAYFNERLKQGYFHSTLTYPLYVQVIFDRKPIFFKSNYFELFSKPRFLLSVPGIPSQYPSIELVKAKESQVIEFIIKKHEDDFSLDLFKKEYTFYSQDLCDVIEKDFIEYLYVFFCDEGMSALGETIRIGSKYQLAYDVVRDLKKGLTKPLYDKMINNSFSYAPPYLPLFGFMETIKRWPDITLCIWEWENKEVQDAFVKYCQVKYPAADIQILLAQIDHLLDFLKNDRR